MEAVHIQASINFVLKIDCHSGEKVHSMCVHHGLLVAKALCMSLAVDYRSVADILLPEPSRGSNSKEKLQITAGD